MANTDYLQLALTGADENSITFKEWRQLINGTSASNMMKIDAGVSALNTALSGKADAEGNWTLLETVTTSEAVTEVICSQTFSGNGIMALCVIPVVSSTIMIYFLDNTGYWNNVNTGSTSNTSHVRHIFENVHGQRIATAQSCQTGWGSGTMLGQTNCAAAQDAYTFTKMSIFTSGASIPSGTQISFYYRP